MSEKTPFLKGTKGTPAELRKKHVYWSTRLATKTDESHAKFSGVDIKADSEVLVAVINYQSAKSDSPIRREIARQNLKVFFGDIPFKDMKSDVIDKSFVKSFKTKNEVHPNLVDCRYLVDILSPENNMLQNHVFNKEAMSGKNLGLGDAIFDSTHGFSGLMTRHLEKSMIKTTGTDFLSGLGNELIGGSENFKVLSLAVNLTQNKKQQKVKKVVQSANPLESIASNNEFKVTRIDWPDQKVDAWIVLKKKKDEKQK